MFQVNQRNGRRWSAADAFLRPALKRPNLEVIDGARGSFGVEFEGGRAVGVRNRERPRARALDSRRARGDPRARARSARRSCCSCRASARPTTCARSAWRSATTCPASAATCRTTRSSRCIWEVSDQNTLYGADKPKPMAEWVLRRTGPLTSSVAEVVAFVRTRPGLPAADVQFHMGAAYYEDHGAETYDGHARDRARCSCQPAGARPGVAALGGSRPTSRGSITNSLSEPDDVRSLVAGMELAREIATQGPLARDHRPRAQARARRARPRATSRPTCAGASC